MCNATMITMIPESNFRERCHLIVSIQFHLNELLTANQFFCIAFKQKLSTHYFIVINNQSIYPSIDRIDV